MRGACVVVWFLTVACVARRPDTPYALDRTPLTPDARRHGERELRRMLEDRAPMAHGLREGDALWEWASGMFAGRGSDRPVLWNAGPPQLGYDADCRHPRDGSPAVIRVRDNTEDAEVLWYRAAYELHNGQNSAAAGRLARDAKAGSIGKDAYVEGITRLEYAALGKTWDFYCAIWRPWAVESGVPTDRRKWPYRFPSRYEDWFRQYDDPDGYPWNSIGLYYDRVAGRERDGSR
jgi:hypothetical protein